MGSDAHRTQFAEKRHRDLLQMVPELKMLPSTLGVPMRILQLHRSGTASMKELSEVIAADSGLSAKILSLVNSAAFSPAAPITRLSQALARIGLKNLLPLAFGFSMGGIFNKLSMPAAERAGVWRASLLKAVTARELCTILAPDMIEEAFLCGLLQDVAMPVIYASDRSAWPETAAVFQIDSDDDRAQRERRMYGTDHAELGGLIVNAMALPKMFHIAVAKHHSGLAGLQEIGNTGLARALDIAASVSHRIAQPNPQMMRSLALRVRASMPGADPAAAAGMLKRIVEKFTAMLAAFGEAEESSVAYKAFLQSLGEEIVLAMESAVSESTSVITNLKAHESQLMEKVSQLQHHAVESDYDSLTQLLNRRGFMSRATRFLALAREYEWPCTIGFVDLNDLKKINDAHGHAAGDAALVATAKQLTEAIGDRGISGRIGGDEFALLTVGKDLAAVSADAQRLKQNLTQFTIAAGEGQITLGASTGIVVIELPSETYDVDMLLKRADEEMYKMKRAIKGLDPAKPQSPNKAA